MSLRTICSAVAIAATTGCHEFRDLFADERCGNQVLERAAGEECDGYPDPEFEGSLCGALGQQHACQLECGKPGTEHACQYLCSGDLDCPPGWGCGLDLACRAPSAQLEDPIVVPIAGDTLRIGDTDGDSRDDIMHFANTAVNVAFGESSGEFLQKSVFQIASPSVPPTSGDLDGDQIADLAIAEPVGILIALGQRNRTFSALTISAEDLPASEQNFRPLPMRAVSPYTRHVTLGVFEQSGALSVRVLEAGQTEIEPAAHDALARLSGDTSEQIAVADLDVELGSNAPATADEAAIVTVGGRVAVIISVECDDVGPAAICQIRHRDTVELGDEPAQIEGSFFADVDGDRDLDLLVVTGESMSEFRELVIARGDGSGGFPERTSAEPELNDLIDCNMCMTRGVSLHAAADMNGDGISDYVTNDGVFTVTATQPWAVSPAARSPTPWRTAVIADFNLDGRPDVAGARPTGLDIFISAGAGEFNMQQSVIAGPPSSFAVGDYDGDLFPDLAVLEGQTTVVVMFGNRSGIPTDRVEMSDGRPIERIASMIDSLGGIRLRDRLNDLVLSTPPGADGRSHVIKLAGSASRRMIAPLFAEDYVLGLAIGKFRPGSTRGDLFFGMNSMTGYRFRLTTGEELFGENVPQTIELQPMGNCPASGGLRALLEAADLNRDGIDEVISLDLPMPGRPHDGSYELHVYSFEDENMICEAPGSIARVLEVGQPRHLRIADFDDDQRLDVAVSFRDPATLTPNDTPNAPAIAVWWGQEAAPYLAREPTVTRLPGLDSMTSFAAAELDGDPGVELGIVDARGIAIADITRQGIALRHERARFPGDPSGINDVERIDANADGLDGLAIATPDEVYIVQHRACTAARLEAEQCVRGTREP